MIVRLACRELVLIGCCTSCVYRPLVFRSSIILNKIALLFTSCKRYVIYFVFMKDHGG